MKPIILAVFSDHAAWLDMNREEAIEYAEKAIGMYHSGTDSGGKLTPKPVYNKPCYLILGYTVEEFKLHEGVGRIIAVMEPRKRKRKEKKE